MFNSGTDVGSPVYRAMNETAQFSSKYRQDYEATVKQIRDYASRHWDEIKERGLEWVFNLVDSSERNDLAVDSSTVADMLDPDGFVLATGDGGNHWNGENAKAFVESYRTNGTYRLVGELGDKPLDIDAGGAYWTGVRADAWDGKPHSTDAIVKWAKENGYTSVIIRNVIDPSESSSGTPSDDYVFFGANNVKSTDPVTYDDAGNVIPLSERFNAEKDDIRFQIASTSGAERLGIRNLGDAEAMERSGATREEIWRETGWWKAKDGKWRIEIPDPTFAKNSLKLLNETGRIYLQWLFLDSPELFKAYPYLNDVWVRVSKLPRGTAGRVDRSLHRDGREDIYIRPSLLKNKGELRSVLLHEVQHLIQHQEGLAEGGSSDEFRKLISERDDLTAKLRTAARQEGYDEWFSGLSQEARDFMAGSSEITMAMAFANTLDEERRGKFHEIADAIRALDKAVNGSRSAWDAYVSLAGEVEARNVQKRLSMTPEERAATPPWETEDVEEERQIVRFQIGGMAEDRKTTAQGPLSESDQTPPVQFSGGATSIPLTRESADPVMKFAGTIAKAGAKSPKDFLVGLFGALGSTETNPDKTQYFDITQPDGRTLSLRTANHRATAHQYKEHGNSADEKLSIVVKMSEKPFKSNKDVELTEFVYFPDKLTAAREADIAKGIASWIRSGNYTGPEADQVNVSPRTSKSDSTKQFQRGEAEARLEQERTELGIRRQSFADLVGLEADAPFELVEGDGLLLEDISPEKALAVALRERPDYAQVLDDIRISAREARLARRELLPDIRFVGKAGRRGEGSGWSDAGALDGDVWQAGLEADVNLDRRRAKMAVAVLTLFVFASGYEKKQVGTRRMVIAAVMTALCFAGRFIPVVLDWEPADGEVTVGASAPERMASAASGQTWVVAELSR